MIEVFKVGYGYVSRERGGRFKFDGVLVDRWLCDLGSRCRGCLWSCLLSISFFWFGNNIRGNYWKDYMVMNYVCF